MAKSGSDEGDDGVNDPIVEQMFDTLEAEIYSLEETVRASRIDKASVEQIIGIYRQALACIQALREIPGDAIIAKALLQKYIDETRAQRVMIETGIVAKKDLAN